MYNKILAEQHLSLVIIILSYNGIVMMLSLVYKIITMESIHWRILVVHRSYLGSSDVEIVVYHVKGSVTEDFLEREDITTVK